MIANHRIIEIRIVFNGLYEWGSGWSETTCRQWKNWLNTKMKSVFWHYTCSDKGSGMESDHLVSTTTSVYLHPMDFHTYIPLTGRSERYVNGVKKETFSSVEELVNLSKQLAEYCGGSAKVDYIKLHEFNDNGTVKTTEIDEGEL